jgi:hypothetical protein
MSDDPSDGGGAPSTRARPRSNALGEERPAFLLEYPHDPELERLIEAFEDGNFARIRREAPELARRTHDDAVRRAALELRRRIDPDPLLLTMLTLSIALFAFITLWIYLER